MVEVVIEEMSHSYFISCAQPCTQIRALRPNLHPASTLVRREKARLISMYLRLTILLFTSSFSLS